MKRQETLEVSKYFDAIFKDVSEWLPSDSSSLSKDKQTLARLTKVRGLSYLTIDLPSELAHLDRCVAQKAYTSSGIPGFTRKSKKDIRPKLFWELYARLFDEAGRLHDDDASAFYYRLLRQLLGGLKKLKLECSDSRTRKAIRDFYGRNATIRRPDGNWLDCQFPKSVRLTDLVDASIGDQSQPGYDQAVLDLQLLDSIQDVSDAIMASCFQGFNPITSKDYRHGPGAVSDVNRYQILKYDVKNWSRRLELSFPVADVLFVNYGDWAGFVHNHDRDWTWREQASTLITVPKTQKGPRLIAAEPTSHMWCQQAVRGFLEDSVHNSFLCENIDFRSQLPNQKLAKHGSANGNLSTIDLTSASDSVSCWLVERMFRKAPALLKAMASCRSRFITQDLDPGSPRLARIHMYSTQGNATTFPVQSIAFALICFGAIQAACAREDINVHVNEVLSGHKPIRVFGDDIIIPTGAVPYVLRALELLEFKTNKDKTFTEGNFRESCGEDYFKGHNVTIAYLRNLSWDSCKRELKSTVDVSNNFYKNGYTNVAKLLESIINDDRIAVTDDESLELAYVRYGEPTYKQVRYNADLHRKEAKILVSSSVVTVKDTGTPGPLLQYFTEEPTQDIVWRSGLQGRPKLRKQLRWVPV